MDALTRTVKQLGGTPKRPKTNFDAVIEGGEKKVLETAAVVENLGAAAYLGQAAGSSREVLAAALAIHTRRGAARRRSQRGGGQDDRPRRRLREAGLDGRGPAAGQAVPRLTRPSEKRRHHMSNDTTMAAPELAAIDIKGVTRQSFIVRGALAAGAVYGREHRRARSSQGAGPGRGRRRRDPELRPDPRVPGGGLLRAGLKQVEGTVGRGEGAGHDAPRQRERARGRAHHRHQGRRRQARQGRPGGGLRMAFGSEKSFLKLAQTFEDTGVSAYNGAGPLIESQGHPRGRGQHRPGGGPPRGGHPAAERRPDHRRRRSTRRSTWPPC